MTGVEGWEGDAPARPRRGLLRWLVFTALVGLAFAATVVALNSGIYSAAGFVDRYLDALDRRDLAVALEMPGVTVPKGASRAALERDALSGLGPHRVVADRDVGAGRHRVTVEYRLGGAPLRSEFVVHAAPPVFLLFGGWRFDESPIARLGVTVQGDDGFRINGVPVDGAEPVEPGVWALDLAVLSPARLVLDQQSRFLTSDEVPVDVTAPSATATVEVRANERFVEDVQGEVDRFLDGCAEQQVLQPAGCPFRKLLDDRILAPPTWSIVSYPQIGIEPQVTDGTFTWAVPAAEGTARISARVLSLFDGTVADLNEDVPFRVAYVLAISEDGDIEIRPVSP
jgi:hypothetical protein